MGKTFDHIPENAMAFIRKQEAFWVATSPLSAEGHINVSPKGLRGSFFIEGPNEVWYEDLTGSGCETIAHVRENGRITVLFNAFQGTPEIVRLYGKGRVHEFGTPEYEARLPLEKRRPGSRAAIVIDVHRVATSCGWGIPIYEFKGHRRLLVQFAKQLEKKDVKAQEDQAANGGGPVEPPPVSIKWYWREMGSKSIDGLPSLQEGHRSQVPIQYTVPEDAAWVDKSEKNAASKPVVLNKPAVAASLLANISADGIIGFLLGIILSYLFARFSGAVADLVGGSQQRYLLF